jgi:hypothetical protein
VLKQDLQTRISTFLLCFEDMEFPRQRLSTPVGANGGALGDDEASLICRSLTPTIMHITQHEDCTSACFGISLTHDAFCDIINFVTTRLDGGATPVRGKYEGVCGSSLRNLMCVHCLDVSIPLLWIFRLLSVYWAGGLS